eukprot:9131328-Ditylum_brightwellii.AAC.1
MELNKPWHDMAWLLLALPSAPFDGDRAPTFHQIFLVFSPRPSVEFDATSVTNVAADQLLLLPTQPCTLHPLFWRRRMLNLLPHHQKGSHACLPFLNAYH